MYRPREKQRLKWSACAALIIFNFSLGADSMCSGTPDNQPITPCDDDEACVFRGTTASAFPNYDCAPRCETASDCADADNVPFCCLPLDSKKANESPYFQERLGLMYNGGGSTGSFCGSGLSSPTGNYFCPSRDCNHYVHANYQGDTVGEPQIVDDEKACCQACGKEPECEVWVYCPDRSRDSYANPDGCDNGSGGAIPYKTCTLKSWDPSKPPEPYETPTPPPDYNVTCENGKGCDWTWNLWRSGIKPSSADAQ